MHFYMGNNIGKQLWIKYFFHLFVEAMKDN